MNETAEILLEARVSRMQKDGKELFRLQEISNKAMDQTVSNVSFTLISEEKSDAPLILSTPGISFEEEQERAPDLLVANKELICQNIEKERQAMELRVANKQLLSELMAINQELAFQNAEKAKRASELIIANQELAVQNKEKEKRAEELHVSIVATTLERRKSEVYLAHLAAIVEFSRDAIISKDLSGIIGSWNRGAEKMFGFSAEEAIGSPISLIIPSDFLNEEKEIMARIHNNEAIDHFETVRIKKCGERFPVSLTVSPIKDDKHTLIGVSKIARDITANKKFEAELIQTNTELSILEKQLKVTNKELEAFSYSVSHDLRIPLRAISGYSAMLKEDYESKLDAEGKRIIDVIVNKTNMMGHLIDDLLSFSKMARLEVVTESIDMNKLAETCLAELLQTETKVQFAVETLAMPECKGDIRMLKQVWYNLIGNAIKYSSKKQAPQIEAGALTNSSDNVYYVKDNGAGFDMQYAKNLFGVFQRLHRQDEFEGTGIGLALVKRIVSKHGGEVWAQSKVNEGSTFYFSIPK